MRPTTAILIADHLWWTRDERSDNLVSWSSSMLFLIRYIFYRHYDSNDRSSLHDIHLLVIDTEKFPARTFIRGCDLISAFEKFDVREKNGLTSMDYLRTVLILNIISANICRRALYVLVANATQYPHRP